MRVKPAHKKLPVVLESRHKAVESHHKAAEVVNKRENTTAIPIFLQAGSLANLEPAVPAGTAQGASVKVDMKQVAAAKANSKVDELDFYTVNWSHTSPGQARPT